MTHSNHIFAAATLLAGSIFLGGCGGGGAAQTELSDDEMHVRRAAEDLAAPGAQGWAGNLGSSILNFDMPWSSNDEASSNEYINTMFNRRFDSQEARYAAMVDDALRAEAAMEGFAISANQVAAEDETRLAGLIRLVAAGQAEDDDMINTMARVRRNRRAVAEGLIEARSWAQTFIEVRDRADMELPESIQAAQLVQSVRHMDRIVNDLVRVSDRMNTSSDRVAAQFSTGR